MQGLQLFRKKNDQMILESWSKVLDKYEVPDVHKTWVAEYAHNQATNEVINESVSPGLYFQKPGSLIGMGNPVPPTPGQTPYVDGQKGLMGDSGSGDKFPSLLPIAIQLAAKTQAFNLVSEIVMDTPAGFIPYVDYVYSGGDLDSEYPPYLIKTSLILSDTSDGSHTLSEVAVGTEFIVSSDGTTSGDYLKLKLVGFGRINAEGLWRVVELQGYSTIKAAFVNSNHLKGGVFDLVLADGTGTPAANNVVENASALENQVAGYTSTASPDNGTDADWTGPWLPTNDLSMMNYGMERGEGEKSKFRQMGLEMHTKFVEAKGNQVAISATVEQIQDFNRVWNFDVLEMLKNIGVNEIAQDLNKEILASLFRLGAAHKQEVERSEGAGIVQLNLTTGGGFENTSTLQRRLLTKLLEMGALIHHRGRWGTGEYIVTNGRVASAINDIKNYSFAPANATGSTGPQLYPGGTAWGLQIYVDPNLKWGDEYIFIGRKGGDEEPGVKFLPYIMGESISTVTEAGMQPKIAYKSRYAITEAGWHPETQYLTMQVDGIGKLVGSEPLA